MKFTNEYPKQETIIETIKEKGSLMCNHKAIIHYRNYQGWMDSIDYYTITGDKNAWYDIKVNFKYDYLMGQVKDTYLDSFGRKMKVLKVL